MNDSRKIELLNELASKLTPQNVDYTPHNGNYCVTLVAVQPVDFFSKEERNFKIQGRLDEGKTISADLIVEGEKLFSINHLPYVAHEGDRTPIYKIVRDSIFCAYGALQLPSLHRSMRKIAWQDYPFMKKEHEEQAKAEIRFMKKTDSYKQQFPILYRGTDCTDTSYILTFKRLSNILSRIRKPDI